MPEGTDSKLLPDLVKYVTAEQIQYKRHDKKKGSKCFEWVRHSHLIAGSSARFTGLQFLLMYKFRQPQVSSSTHSDSVSDKNIRRSLSFSGDQTQSFNPYHVEKLTKVHFFVNSFLSTFYSTLDFILITITHVLLLTIRYYGVMKCLTLQIRLNNFFIMTNEFNESY